MKQIMIIAYTQFNLGDDLFIKILIERYPHVHFTLHAPKYYQHVFRQHTNIQVIATDTWRQRLIRHIPLSSKWAKQSQQNHDATVLIGGSLFAQKKDWRKTLNNYQQLQAPNKPFYILGANFGPYDNSNFYHAYVEWFKNLTDICFRDMYSYHLFNDIHHVRVASDVVFQLSPPVSVDSENTIVISLIKPSNRPHLSDYDHLYYQSMANIATYAIEQGYSVTLVGFCHLENDDIAIKHVINRITQEKRKYVEHITYSGDIDRILTIIAKAKLIIASRFHAMILGWVMHKPVFPITYSFKMTNVIKDVSFPGHFCELTALKTLSPSDVLQEITAPLLDTTHLGKQATEQFKQLDQFLTL